MRSKSCRFRNLVTISAPNVKLTPRSFSPHPCTSLSGSDQSKSHRSPVSGTSVGRMILRICSIPWWWLLCRVLCVINIYMLSLYRVVDIGRWWGETGERERRVKEGETRNQYQMITFLVLTINPWSKSLLTDGKHGLTCKSGLNPPWQQKIFSSIMAAMGRQLKQSVNVFQSFTLYRRLHSS